MESFKSKVAFITGGSKGIGYGVAEALLKLEMRVAITSRSKESAEKAASELSKIGKGEVLGLEADVRDYKSQEAAIEKVISKWGQLDVMVANAGIGHFGNIAELSIEDWKETIDTNLSGVFYSLKAAVPGLKKSKGYAITISSLAGTNFFEGGTAYNASKFGVTGLNTSCNVRS